MLDLVFHLCYTYKKLTIIFTDEYNKLINNFGNNIVYIY